jgi:hypothetical protein
MSQLGINILAAQSGSVIHLSSHVSGSSASSGSFGRVETDNLTVGGSQGSDGEVLTSTGTGVAWEAAGGGVDGIVSTANATAITIDSLENIGIGVSPDSGNWGSRANTVIHIGVQKGALWSYSDPEPEPPWYQLHLSENVRYPGPDENVVVYYSNGPATDHQQKQGTHTFKVATSGNEDYEISWNDAMVIANDGDITGTHGDYHVSSDERLKKDIITIPNALDKVLALRGVNFKWKNKEDTNLMMGMIAQEVESVIPEVVHAQDDEMETKAVEYQFIVGVLIEAVKELSAKVEALENA